MRNAGHQQTVAEISLQAALPKNRQFDCVAVFTEALARHRLDIHADIFPVLLAEVKRQLGASRATMEMWFPYFLRKVAPVSKTESLMEYRCSFTGSSNGGNDLLLAVQVPLTTLCPCSKEISEEGAHNQRAEVVLTVRPNRFIWLEELIGLVEQCGSCELYALLKRPDEKHVTETAYKNPMFVEDVVRMIAQKAAEHEGIGWFSVSVESFESIHKHSAYALVDSDDL
jgi:GTP cyclohydrolase I